MPGRRYCRAIRSPAPIRRCEAPHPASSPRATIVNNGPGRMTSGGNPMSVRMLIVTVLLAAALPALAQETTNEPFTKWPGYQESDYIVRDYKFTSGQSLTEVKLHYRTIGTAKRN